MSTHNLCFNGELTKIILQLSSNTLLICSSGWGGEELGESVKWLCRWFNTIILCCQMRKRTDLRLTFTGDSKSKPSGPPLKWETWQSLISHLNDGPSWLGFSCLLWAFCWLFIAALSIFQFVYLSTPHPTPCEDYWQDDWALQWRCDSPWLTCSWT